MTSIEERFEHALMREKNYDQYDAIETMKMYQQLADEGYAPAQCKSAMAYNAMGMDDQCIGLLEKACAQNDARALAQMGVFYYNGKCGLIQSHAYAFALYTRAAQLGESTAMFNLAMMYQEGEGCEQDVHEAAGIYRDLTAIPGEVDAGAAFHLGVLCLTGKLGNETRVKAEGMVMLQEAAAEGHEGARELLSEYKSAMK
mmetsp:Transcript_29333/g.62330  ORF Transcript_29333/g.62330 Transcript_29333/m.62330 type:complete len:200 (+) Transcript_29333:106-705(+)